MISLTSSILMTFLIILASMAFFTLLERKALGYFQIRKGPNKVSLAGLPQPLADAVKLFSKEVSYPSHANTLPFILSPFFTLILALLMWLIYPSHSPILFIKLGVLFFLCVSSFSVYTILAAGWTSNSKYSLLGSLRGVAQTISYEVRISLILLSALIIMHSFNTQNIFNYFFSYVILVIPIITYIWFTTTLAETNRTPFDFAEGERELVSGFNTEYSAGTFAMIFIAEYTNIIVMSILSAIFFIGNLSSPFNSLFFICKVFAISFLFIWARGSFPRIRYDRLINLTWKSFLPISLVSLLIVPTIIY